MQIPDRTTVRAIALVFLLIAALAGVARAVLEPAPGSVTAALGGPGPTATVTTTEDALEQVKSSEVGDHRGARDETPPGYSPAAAQRNRQAQAIAKRKDDLPAQLPAAAPSQRGCRSQFARNYSSRNGVAPRAIALHFTVSYNRPGWSDVNALTIMANDPRTGVSWHYNLDREGNCAYVVREVDKAWTAAAANPWLIQFEIVAFGIEPSYLPHKSMVKLAKIIADIDQRWATIDATKRAVFHDCRPVSTGVIDHRALGNCAGGHVDITKAFPGSLDRVIRYVVVETKRRSEARRRDRVATRRCRELAHLRSEAVGRRKAHKRPAWRLAQRQRAQALRDALGARAPACR